MRLIARIERDYPVVFYIGYIWSHIILFAVTLRIIAVLGWILLWNVISFWIFYTLSFARSYIYFKRYIRQQKLRHTHKLYETRSRVQADAVTAPERQSEKEKDQVTSEATPAARREASPTLKLEKSEEYTNGSPVDYLLTFVYTMLSLLYPIGFGIRYKVSDFRKWLHHFPPAFPLSSHDYFWLQDTDQNCCQIVALAITDRLTLEELQAAVRRRWLSRDRKLKSVTSQFFYRSCWSTLR